MRPNKTIIVILLIVISTISYANKEYKAYECISYVHFDWGEYKGDRFDILNDFGLYRVMHNVKLFVDKNNIKYLGGRQMKNGSGVYLRFANNCKNKTQMSEQIMKQYAKNIKNFPKYFVTEALIMPHRTTFLKGGNI